MFQPGLFISHGAPDIVLRTEHPTYTFLTEFGQKQPRPDAIVIFSGHWLSPHPMVSDATSYRPLYDFGGFDPKLYSLRYTPQGNLELAQMVAGLLRRYDARTEIVTNTTIDHGIWIPLLLMYPDANIPVVEVAMESGKPARYYYELGKTLAELKTHNVLVIGSGAMTHDLSGLSLLNHDALPPPRVTVFAEWMKDKLETGGKEAVMQYQQLAPYAWENHPTDDHIIPLFFAMGAGGDSARRIHTATTYKTVMMDAYAFSDDNIKKAA